MSVRRFPLATVLVLALFAITGLLGCGGDEVVEGDEALEAVARSAESTDDGVTVRLFYPGASALLELEQRSLILEPLAETEATLEDQRRALASAVTRAVLAPPQEAGLHPAFEEGTELISLEFFSDGLVLVTLGPPAGSVNRGLGSRAELLRIFSLVNSLAYSVRGVQSVLLVWGDSQPATLGGHVDTTRPIKPSLRWVAPESQRVLQRADASSAAEDAPPAESGAAAASAPR